MLARLDEAGPADALAARNSREAGALAGPVPRVVTRRETKVVDRLLSAQNAESTRRRAATLH